MNLKLSCVEAEERIDLFFARQDFTAEEVKKIKRLAMKYNIKLGVYKKQFCKKCFSKLKGKIKVSKKHKTIECAQCGYKNRFTLS